MNTTQPASLGTTSQGKLIALSLATVLTLGMLLGIQTLAEVPEQAVQLAHVSPARA